MCFRLGRFLPQFWPLLPPKIWNIYISKTTPARKAKLSGSIENLL